MVLFRKLEMALCSLYTSTADVKARVYTGLQ